MQLGRDLQRAELISVPVTLAILVVTFGAIVAAGAPVVLAFPSAMAPIGLSSLAVGEKLPSRPGSGSPVG